MNQTQETDESLMTRYQQGQVHAFDILLSRHKTPVYNFLYRSVKDKAIAEDMLQEVFLRIVKSAQRYKQKAKFTTWMYTIARNLCIDRSRRMKHRRAASLEAPLYGSEKRNLHDKLASEKPGPDRQATSGRIQQRIELAVADLSQEQCEVFLLRHMQGLPFREISNIVGVSENTVKSRMRYALEKLQAALAEYAELAKAVAQ